MQSSAVQFAANVLPIIRDIQAAGHVSLNACRTAQCAEGRYRQWWPMMHRQNDVFC